jgi:Ca2+:H+ antiporter
MAVDIYRRQARNLAWYDEEGEASSHNPFKKFRRSRQLHRSNSVQLESGPSRSLGDLSEDHRRRQDMNSGLGGPEYSGSFPPEFLASEHGTPSTHRSPPEPSVESHDPINVSRGLDAEPADSGLPRQRKGGFLGKFRHHDDVSAEDKKSLSEPQKFTLASQLRATILNSWINVLLVAAPVGSRCCSAYRWVLHVLIPLRSCSLCRECSPDCGFRGQLCCYHVGDIHSL